MLSASCDFWGKLASCARIKCVIYISLVISGFILGCICAYIYEKAMPVISKKQSLIISGYKLHHSIYGLVLVLMSFLLTDNTETRVFLIASGIGVIFEHYKTGGGLDFVTKES